MSFVSTCWNLFMFDELAYYQVPVREVKHNHVPSEFVPSLDACLNKCSHVQVT